MSIDRSLKQTGGLAQHRNILTRAERLDRLKATSGFDSSKKPVLGLPKTANRKSKVAG